MDNSATPNAMGSSAGESSAVPACATPNGTATTAAMEVPKATVCGPWSLPAFCPNTMYSAQHVPAPSA